MCFSEISALTRKIAGGHAPGMRVYLGTGVLQSAVADFFAQKKTRRRDLPWRLAGGAIVDPSRQVSSIWQEDDCSHQTDGTYRLEANQVSISMTTIEPIRPQSRTRFDEGAGTSRCQAQAVALFVSDIRLNSGRFDCGVPGSISCLGPTKVRVQHVA